MVVKLKLVKITERLLLAACDMRKAKSTLTQRSLWPNGQIVRVLCLNMINNWAYFNLV